MKTFKISTVELTGEILTAVVDAENIFEALRVWSEDKHPELIAQLHVSE